MFISLPRMEECSSIFRRRKDGELLSRINLLDFSGVSLRWLDIILTSIKNNGQDGEGLEEADQQGLHDGQDSHVLRLRAADLRAGADHHEERWHRPDVICIIKIS